MRAQEGSAQTQTQTQNQGEHPQESGGEGNQSDSGGSVDDKFLFDSCVQVVKIRPALTTFYLPNARHDRIKTPFS